MQALPLAGLRAGAEKGRDPLGRWSRPLFEPAKQLVQPITMVAIILLMADGWDAAAGLVASPDFAWITCEFLYVSG